MIFLDNASTTRVDKEVLDTYNKYCLEKFYNPSAPYRASLDVRNEIARAEKNIIESLCGDEKAKIIFTGSATESNNMAILKNLNKRYKTVLMSIGEHSSIKNLENEIIMLGYNVEFVKLDEHGRVDIDDFKSKMSIDVGVVAIMHVSNETGAINDIEKLVKISKQINPNCHFHCDGVQALCKIDVNLKKLGIDSYTFSGHKIFAPKGIAGLYVKDKIKPFIIGGGQQNNLRGGTENVPGIMALEVAIKKGLLQKSFDYVQVLNNKAREILSTNKDIKINSDENCSPYILSISCLNVNGATLVNMLDDKGICVGTGSACSSKKAGNETLLSMGLKTNEILGGLRLSFSKDNTMEEVQEACNEIILAYNKLKRITMK